MQCIAFTNEAHTANYIFVLSSKATWKNMKTHLYLFAHLLACEDIKSTIGRLIRDTNRTLVGFDKELPYIFYFFLEILHGDNITKSRKS